MQKKVSLSFTITRCMQRTMEVKAKQSNMQNRINFSANLRLQADLDCRCDIQSEEMLQEVNLMRMLTGRTWGCSNKSLLSIYEALVRSVLD